MQLRNYEWSILVSIPIALLLAIIYICVLHCGGFALDAFGVLTLPPVVSAMLGVIVIVSAFVSGASYLGRAIDAWQTPTKDTQYEGFLTVFGVAFGFSVSCMLLIGGFSVPFSEAIPLLPQITFVMTMIGTCAGLCARVGRVVDRKWSKKNTVIEVDFDEVVFSTNVSSAQFESCVVRPQSVCNNQNYSDNDIEQKYVRARAR